MEELSNDISIRGSFEIILKILNIKETDFIDDKYYINAISYEQINKIIEIVPSIYNYEMEGYIKNKDLIDLLKYNEDTIDNSFDVE